MTVAGALTWVVLVAAGCATAGGSGTPGADAGAGEDSGTVHMDASADACPYHETMCGGACTNTTFDPSNCGGCGKACPSGA